MSIFNWFHKRGTGLIYPELFKGDEMRDEEMLMMPIQDDLMTIIAELTQENKRLNEINEKQADTIQALTLDLHIRGN